MVEHLNYMNHSRTSQLYSNHSDTTQLYSNRTCTTHVWSCCVVELCSGAVKTVGRRRKVDKEIRANNARAMVNMGDVRPVQQGGL